MSRRDETNMSGNWRYGHSFITHFGRNGNVDRNKTPKEGAYEGNMREDITKYKQGK